jgi:hypothetical protein
MYPRQSPRSCLISFKSFCSLRGLPPASEGQPASYRVVASCHVVSISDVETASEALIALSDQSFQFLCLAYPVCGKDER